MRWSCTLTLFVIEFLAVSLPAIHALPLPENLDLLTRGNDKKVKTSSRYHRDAARQSSITGGNDKKLKKSSRYYRNAARQSSTSFEMIDGILTKVHHDAPHTPKKGQDAGTHYHW